VRVLARNQFIFLPVLLMALGEVLVLRGWQVESELPSLGRFLLELGGQAVCALTIFYTTHRILHRRFWMKRVHLVHHQFRTSTALASEYAHPIEFAVGNFFTLAGGALLLAPHLASMYVFALLSVLTIVFHHCGYALPWAPYSLPHDWHHYRVKELFGTTGLLDRLLGTDEEFRNFVDGDELR
jgi:sterol desaturase/sphingolipid hydroxylase (fatty acid hydroxylase superfamily)